MIRFTLAERIAHRTLAVLMIVLILTAAALYIPDISALVGNRPLVKNIHSYSGFLLPLPLLFALFSPAFRRDASEAGRFHPHDWAWLRRRNSPSPSLSPTFPATGKVGAEADKSTSVYPSHPVESALAPAFGKFNAGQKLNAAFTVGAVTLMFATGMIMFFSSLVNDNTRTGATFVHDWLTLAIVAVVIGHIYKAYNDSEARSGMRTGTVSYRWAKRHHPQWEQAYSNHELGKSDTNRA